MPLAELVIIPLVTDPRLRFGVGEKLVIQADGALAVDALVAIVALIFVFGGGTELLLWLNGSWS